MIPANEGCKRLRNDGNPLKWPKAKGSQSKRSREVARIDHILTGFVMKMMAKSRSGNSECHIK